MTNVITLLDKEWQRLGNDRATARKLRDVCHVAGGARTLAGVETYVRNAAPPDADRVLLALVARAVDGDHLAARVLLHLLMPGVRRLARRWWALGDGDERAAAAVAAVYDRICRYPLARRPGRVAANILLDAGQDLRRAVPRVIATPYADPTTHHATMRMAPTSDPAQELAGTLRDAVEDGLICSDDAELIIRSRINGHRMADIADERGLAARTLWDRRRRAEAVLTAA